MKVQTSSGGHGSLGQPTWFTPFRFTLLLCFMLFWVYVDRGAFSSTSVNGYPRTPQDPKGMGIQGDFNLSNFEDGLLSSVFMIGMLIASPLFSEAVHRVNAMRVLGIGLGIWMLAVLGSGIAWNFWSLVFFRSFVGFGEAAIVVLSPPFIDDHAPADKKGVWLACLYSSIPVGIGGGYIIGGIIGDLLHWRATFLIEAAVMLPVVLFALFAKPVDLKKEAGSPHRPSEKSSSIVLQFFDHLGIILSHPVFILTVAGYTIYTGVVGLVAYWGPKAAMSMFNIGAADIFMGSTSIATGVAGTLVGGLVMDQVGSSMPKALTLSFVAIMASVCFLIPSFLVAKNFAWFVAPFSMTTILLFFVQAPVNAVLLWAVPQDQRALAAAANILSVHLFGDVPSPAAYGALLDTIMDVVHNEAEAYRQTMAIVGVFLFISGVVFMVAAIVSRKAVDYRYIEERLPTSTSEEEDVNNDDHDDDNLESAPLLGRLDQAKWL